MPNISRNFIKGRMNKSVDERLLPDGEYIDALNVRMGSTEESEIGVIENTKGNFQLTTLINPVNSEQISSEATCVGAFADSANETMYWFVHDGGNNESPNNICDLIVSYNTESKIVTYHVVSCVDPNDSNKSTLNFQSNQMVLGVNLIDGLLFFTDNFNQPRVINVNRDYPLPDSTTFQDYSLLEEDIRVIKKPPLVAPSVDLIQVPEGVNFIDERFACFAYRYRYADGQYSATSPFTSPAFAIEPFNFAIESFLNEGMTNNFNAAEITFQTGNKLVRSIELLYKDASNGIIKVIKKFNKDTDPVPNNSSYTFRFDKDKIFTILPESEILRLYDNVPLKALGQTLMGNRLMFGNYVEGYDLKDSSDNPVQFRYFAELETQEVDFEQIDARSFYNGIYNISGTSRTISDSVVEFDFSNIQPSQLIAGARLEFSAVLRHESFDANNPTTTNQQSPDINITFSYQLNQDFPQGIDFLFQSQNFLEAVGTSLNIQTVPNSCQGTTFTDEFNCQLPNQLNYVGGTSLNKVGSGINGTGEPILATVPSTGLLRFQFPAVKWEDLSDSAEYAYEYFRVITGAASFIGAAGSASLHSNRDYEFAIVYMDDYGRSSTPLVSDTNVIHVPCGNSPLVNKAKITIPTSQKPPSWATKYKFVARANKANYLTIFSHIYFTDERTGEGYILLEGENGAKVEVGDRYIIKADNSGPTNTCEYITVLAKEAQPPNFLDDNRVEPAGLYMKVQPNNIDLNYAEDNFVKISGSDQVRYRATDSSFLTLRTQEQDPSQPGSFIDIPIPTGSRVKIYIDINRDNGTGCEAKTYLIDETFVASRDYVSFYDFFIGEKLESVFTDPANIKRGSANILFQPNNSFNSRRSGGSRSLIEFCFGGSTLEFLRIRGFINCRNRNSNINANIQIFKSDRVLVFETLPEDTNPDIFYENENVFDISNGFHLSPTQDQTASQPAICYPNFFNCYAFGNGVESYKMRDSATGTFFELGNRALSVSSEDSKQAHRFADITYSGIYNDESNVNKLNEFNLGLLNFKTLEESYGVITLIDGRETDVFTLQEDKVSYVLVGKNLLSDAAAGGAITSVPEVLGTQIARIEDYGNSFNPESHVQWGDSRYFTDSKRGAVIQMKGVGKSESLTVISELGMRSWFRDLFIDSYNTKKLGGYDPYMGEYVLSSTTDEVTSTNEPVSCGVTQQNIQVNDANPSVSFDVQLTNTGEQIDISYTILSLTGTATITTDFGGGTPGVRTISSTSDTGYATNINNFGATSVRVTIDRSSNGDEITFQSFEVGCPYGSLMDVVEVVVTNNDDANETLHIEYEYEDPTNNLISIRRSDGIVFQTGTNPLVSRYDTIAGPQGTSFIPFDGSTLRVYTNKVPGDSFDVPTGASIGYLATNTDYPNTPAGISSLLSLAAFQSLPIGGAERSISITNITLQDKLYLVWDLRSSSSINLCYDSTLGNTVADVCCDVTCFCNEQCSQYSVTFNDGSIVDARVQFTDCDTGLLFTNTVVSGTNVCSRTLPTVFSANGGSVNDVEIAFSNCGSCSP